MIYDKGYFLIAKVMVVKGFLNKWVTKTALLPFVVIKQ